MRRPDRTESQHRSSTGGGAGQTLASPHDNGAEDVTEIITSARAVVPLSVSMIETSFRSQITGRTARRRRV
ncbi:MAG TPA: hypothetical protein VFQ91_15000 [Bryobacteraceae bacterium]|nr:hypothetical protein [Bryobacteraceae bacterium]